MQTQNEKDFLKNLLFPTFFMCQYYLEFYISWIFEIHERSINPLYIRIFSIYFFFFAPLKVNFKMNILLSRKNQNYAHSIKFSYRHWKYHQCFSIRYSFMNIDRSNYMLISSQLCLSRAYTHWHIRTQVADVNVWLKITDVVTLLATSKRNITLTVAREEIEREREVQIKHVTVLLRSLHIGFPSVLTWNGSDCHEFVRRAVSKSKKIYGLRKR